MINIGAVDGEYEVANMQLAGLLSEAAGMDLRAALGGGASAGSREGAECSCEAHTAVMY